MSNFPLAVIFIHLASKRRHCCECAAGEWRKLSRRGNSVFRIASSCIVMLKNWWRIWDSLRRRSSMSFVQMKQTSLLLKRQLITWNLAPVDLNHIWHQKPETTSWSSGPAVRVYGPVWVTSNHPRHEWVVNAILWNLHWANSSYFIEKTRDEKESWKFYSQYVVWRIVCVIILIGFILDLKCTSLNDLLIIQYI